MVTRRKPQVKKLKFELTRSAIAGIGVIVFCLFLWMFLLGVWAGQSLLLPSDGEKEVMANREKVSKGSRPLVIRAEKKAIKKEKTK
jgi:hypothetical protein